MAQWAGLNPDSRRNGWYCGEGDQLLRMSASTGPNCPQPLLRGGSHAMPLVAGNASVAVGSLAVGGAGDVGGDTDGGDTKVSRDTKASRDTKHAPLHEGHDQQEEAAQQQQQQLLRWPAGPFVAPFASGGVDIRSHALAKLVAASGYDAKFAHEWTSAGGHRGCEDYRASCAPTDWAAACDGLQGYLVGLALRDGARGGAALDVTALHLTASKFHRPPLTPSTSVVHGGSLKGAATWTAEPVDWRYHVGSAMLPLPMRLTAGAKGLHWEALSTQAVHAFENERRRKGAGCASVEGAPRSIASERPIDEADASEGELS